MCGVGFGCHRSALNLSDDRHFSGEQWGPTFNMPFTRGWQMDVTLLPRITEGSCFTEPFWEEHRLFFGTGEAPLFIILYPLTVTCNVQLETTYKNEWDH